MNIFVAIVAESSIIFSFLFFCFSIGIWKLDVFNGGLVGTIISVDVDILLVHLRIHKHILKSMKKTII